MQLSGKQIGVEVQNGGLVISDFNQRQQNPNSYNLKLGKELLVYSRPSWWRRLWLWLTGDPWHLDMKKKNPVEHIIIPPEGYIIKPGVLYLGHTEEYTETPTMAPRLDGRSSVGRLGMFIHATAGFGDVGFRGQWTLEITTIHPLRIYAGVSVCQIAYETVCGEFETYHGKYQHQNGPKESQLWKDFVEQE